MSLPVPASAARVGADGAGALTLRDVVAFLDARPDDAGVAEFAAALAHEHGAHLAGVFILPVPPASTHDSFVVGKAVLGLLAEQDAMCQRMEDDRRRLVDGIVGRYGVKAESRVIPSFTNYDAIVHARYGDVAVIARSDAEEHWGHRGLLDALILTSGRPIVVLPPRCRSASIRRVLVAWNAKRETARAMADALPLLVKAEAVTVLTVDAEPGRGGHGEEPGADAARHLARHGANVDVRRVSSGRETVGHVILAQASALRADLVVMGAYGRPWLTEQVFGSVTQTVRREAGIPVLMSH